MSFKNLLAKVTQAEDVLEARERQVAANLRQVQASWLAAWTPGRIVVAGLVSGFLVGRTQPLRLATQGGQWVQLVSLLSGLFASANAQAAASNAEDAAVDASDVAQTVAPAAASARASGNETTSDAVASTVES